MSVLIVQGASSLPKHIHFFIAGFGQEDTKIIEQRNFLKNKQRRSMAKNNAPDKRKQRH